MVCQEADSCSPGEKTPTAIRNDDESLSKRVSSFVIEIAKLLMRVAKHGDEWTAQQLVDFLPDTTIYLKFLTRYIGRVVDRKNVTT